MPELAIGSPSPLRPTATTKWPARTLPASPVVTGAKAAASSTARRNRARSVDESRPTRVASTVLPSPPTRVIAAGERRNTCAAVTTMPGCQTVAVASVPRRPRTAKVPAARCSTRAASASERSASGKPAESGAGPGTVLLFMAVIGTSGDERNVRAWPTRRIRRTAGAASAARVRRWCVAGRFARPAGGPARLALDRIAMARVVVQGPVGVVQATGDGPRPVGQLPAVDPGDRQHAAAGRAEKDLVGGRELGRGHRRHPEGDRQRVAQLDHRLARDALEHAAVGRAHDAVLDHEDVEPGALGDVALRIDHAAGVGAAVVGIE